MNFNGRENWLGWQDSNLRMAIPKTAALPLGYTPARDVSYFTQSKPLGRGRKKEVASCSAKDCEP